MSQKTFVQLEHLRQLNSNRTWANQDVYRLMYKEDLYILAYERIKSRPGNMTPGTDEETLDGFSLEAIREIIQEMRTEQFHFKPVRTTFIPKANGKMRKLGIPCVRDKIVQEVMHMILEAIYDSPHGSYFQETSHGFRPNRSCHTALREFRGKWQEGKHSDIDLVQTAMRMRTRSKLGKPCCICGEVEQTAMHLSTPQFVCKCQG